VDGIETFENYVIYTIQNMPSSSALPLNVTPASTPSKAAASLEGGAYKASTSAKQAGISNPSDISSPHELTAFVGAAKQGV